MMKKRQIIIPWILAALFCIRAYAAGPGQFSAFSDEEYLRLMDQTVEWDEIQNLVTYFNPTYRIYADSAENTGNELTMARDSFKEEMQENIDTIDENLEKIKEQRNTLSKLPGNMVVDPSGATAAQMIAMLDQTGAALKESRGQVKKAIGQGSSSVAKILRTTEDSLKPVREQLAYVVEGLVISYHEILANRTLVEKQISLYRTMLDTQKDLYARNMATALDVQAAEGSLREAEATLRTVDDGLLRLRTAIGLQLGWSADNPPEIGPLPAPDVSYLLTVNKEADYQKVLSENDAYEQTGKVKNYSGDSAVYQRDRAVNEANAKASARFDRLYADLLSRKMLYDTAGTSLQVATLSRDRARRMNELGLTAKAEYEGLELQVLSYEANASLSAISLFQAINDYRWALRGFMTY